MTTEVRETEQKYEVEADVALPSFAGLPRVASVSEPELQTLTAEYYDADDLLVLARGAHLRPPVVDRRPSDSVSSGPGFIRGPFTAKPPG